MSYSDHVGDAHHRPHSAQSRSRKHNLSAGQGGATKSELERELNHVYRLYAIIVHVGYSTLTGHYFPIIKNEENDLWYKYDDTEV